MGNKCSVVACVILKPTFFSYVSGLQTALRGGWELTLPHLGELYRITEGTPRGLSNHFNSIVFKSTKPCSASLPQMSLSPQFPFAFSFSKVSLFQICPQTLLASLTPPCFSFLPALTLTRGG